jgi:hypothetical protein
VLPVHLLEQQSPLEEHDAPLPPQVSATGLGVNTGLEVVGAAAGLDVIGAATGLGVVGAASGLGVGSGPAAQTNTRHFLP